MKYVEAPKVHAEGDLPRPWIFLAGGITGCPEWQRDIKELLHEYDCTIFNPRRADFDINDPDTTTIQIAWEFKYLQEVDLVTFWFAKETIQPIVLYELGFFLGKLYGRSNNGGTLHDQASIIGVHAEYPRIVDIVHQTSNVDPEITQLINYSFDAHVDTIKLAIDTYKEMLNDEN